MPYRYLARKTRDFVVDTILGRADTPHRIALGVAIGVFVTWTPTFGVQMLLVVILCMIFRANKVVGVPLVWIANPFTLAPLYGSNYWVGIQVMELFGYQYTWASFSKAIEQALSSTPTWLEKCRHWWQAMDPILAPLWAGSIVVGAILGAGAYLATYHGVRAYRKPHPTPSIRTGRRRSGAQGARLSGTALRRDRRAGL